MSTSATSIPSRASWLFSRRQNAHHCVVYIVTGSDTHCSHHLNLVPLSQQRDGVPASRTAKQLPRVGGLGEDGADRRYSVTTAPEPPAGPASGPRAGQPGEPAAGRE